MRFNSSVKMMVGISVALAGLALALPGCGNKSTGPLIAAPASPIADIPVPAGFEMDAGKSTSTVVPSTSFRTAYHLYKGGDDMLPVVNFYRTEMPAKGWTLVDQTQQKDEVTIRFNKAKETASVTVKEALIKTHIIVKLGPSDAVSSTPK